MVLFIFVWFQKQDVLVLVKTKNTMKHSQLLARSHILRIFLLAFYVSFYYPFIPLLTPYQALRQRIVMARFSLPGLIPMQPTCSITFTVPRHLFQIQNN